MGASLARAAIALGHEVTIVSGPVQIDYPHEVLVIPVITTEEMLDATTTAFQDADGLIGAAAPCDYMPTHVLPQKISKTGSEVMLKLIETPDIVATLGSAKKKGQWVVGFALESDDRRFRSIVKMQRKCCDLMVSNGPSAIDSLDNEVEVLDRLGNVIASLSGPKELVAVDIMQIVQVQLIQPE